MDPRKQNFGRRPDRIIWRRILFIFGPAKPQHWITNTETIIGNAGDKFLTGVMMTNNMGPSPPHNTAMWTYLTPLLLSLGPG